MRKPFRSNTAKLAAMALLAMQTSSLEVWAQSAGPSNALPTTVDSSFKPVAAVSTSSKGSTTVSSLPLVAGRNLVIDFALSPLLNLTSNFKVPSGTTVYAISTNPNVNTATIKAPNILILPGSTITSVLPAGGLAGFANANSGLSLSLIALTNFTNQGTISSAGNLNIFAGNQLVNAGATAANPGGVMQALGNVNLFAPNIVNQGMISSIAGNININNPAQFQSTMANIMNATNLASVIGNTLNLYAVGGTFSAQNNSINIGGTEFSALSSFNLVGGDFLSKTLNLDMGQGVINATLNEVTGVTNFAAREVHFGSSTENLLLGNMCITGDPTFFNAGGNITLTAPLGNGTVGDDLAILARDNVDLANFDITTVDPNGIGRNLVIVAGANLTPSVNPAAAPNPAIPAGSGPLTAGSVKAQGVFGAGGSIFSTGGPSSISTSATAPNADAGNVTLIAYGGGIDGLDIFANGNGTGKNGGLTAIAGGPGPVVTANGINALSFQALSGSGTTGNTNLSAATVSGSATFGVNGKAQGSFAPGALTGLGISVNSINTNGGNVSIKGAGISASSIITAPALASFGRSGGSVTISSVGSVTSSDINVTGLISTSGVAGAAGVGNAAGKAGGNGGAISITQTGVGSPPVISLSDIESYGGAGGTGGNNAAGGKGGNGGKITITSTVGSIFMGDINGNSLQRAGGTGGDGGLGTTGGTGGAGGNGSLISITSNGGSITAKVINAGGSGGNGGSGTGIRAGGQGGAGQPINIKASIATTLDIANPGLPVRSSGGNGGFGGAALSKNQAGGLGGKGGDGANIVLSVNSKGTILGGNLFSVGGIGGTGGNGWNATAAGEIGGAGGAGGIAGAAGNITISSATTHSLGGLFAGGALGGFGGNGGLSAKNGGTGGAGGAGANGGAAGKISIGLIPATVLSFDQFGLGAGQGGDGGTGGKGGPGGAGGAGGNGGAAGAASDFTLTGGSSITQTGSVSSVGGGFGGFGGAGGDGGNAALAGQKGGKGGNGGNSGAGSSPGNITITTAKNITLFDTNASGGAGSLGGKGGKGGDGLANTAGGAGGNGGDTLGGTAGSNVSISSTNGGDLTLIVGAFFGISGNGGAPGGPGAGGDGGNGSTGGIGGNSGHGADGGEGGNITLSTKGNVTISNANAVGGDGSFPTSGGKGGNGTAGAGGAGGGSLSQGNGANAGTLTITIPKTGVAQNITLQKLNFDGGRVILGFIGGGDGGSGTTSGGNGGNVGTALVKNAVAGIAGTTANTSSMGAPGEAGSITVNATGANVIVPGNDAFAQPIYVTANGGQAAASSLTGGKGGAGGSGNGGAGGSIAVFGSNPKLTTDGGTITINSMTLDVRSGTQAAGIIQANAGPFDASATAGDGGDGKSGGQGGSVLAFTSAVTTGKGGTIKITAPGSNTPATFGLTNDGTIEANGGFVSTPFALGIDLRSGKGGNALLNGGTGGNSGSIGMGPSAGNGGSIIISRGSGEGGVTRVGAFGSIFAFGGTVSPLNNYVTTVGAAGKGFGTGNSFGGNSGSIGKQGNSGNGGTLQITSGTRGVNQFLLSTSGGQLGAPAGNWTATVGAGGDAGTTGSGRGGNSGNVGTGGSSGHGGTITISTNNADIEAIIQSGGGIVFNNVVNVGAGGKSTSNLNVGGNSGNIGKAGNGGAGGKITLKSGSGDINTVGHGAITAIGGIGGGFDSSPIGAGGDGGSGGKGGSIGVTGNGGAGGIIQITSTGDVSPVQLIAGGERAGTLGIISAGNGGNAFAPPLPGKSGSGGAGGNIGGLGSGGNGGTITVSADTIGATLVVQIHSNGGSAAQFANISPGSGGDSADANGGHAGTMGAPGTGGKGGTLKISAAGNITLQEVQAKGGSTESISDIVFQAGGNANNGTAGDSGSMASGKTFGNGGSIDISSTNGILTLNLDVDASGGADPFGYSLAACCGGAGKNGGTGTIIGAMSSGGNGGSIKISAVDFVIPVFGRRIQANGGAGANQNNISGDGGDGTFNGGNAGSLGNAGNGGNAGQIKLTVKVPTNPVVPDVVLSNLIFSAAGGAGGDQSGLSGVGGQNIVNPSSNNGGNGGAIGKTGTGGKGGLVSISDTNAKNLSLAALAAYGGAAGRFTGSLGGGGNGVIKGGAGGSFAGTANGGNGGTLEVIGSKANITLTADLTVQGGSISAPSNNALDAAGGSGATGGIGGSIGPTGNTGKGGTIRVTQNSLTSPIRVLIADGGQLNGATTVFAGVGGAGIGATSTAGKGGSIGNFGKTGDGGTIKLSLANGVTAGSSLLEANGGNVQNVITVNAGAGGDATNGFNGADGGNIGKGPGTGKGGTIQIDTGAGAPALPSNESRFGIIQAAGGFHFIFAGTTGAGSDAKAASNGKGGNSGKALSPGNSGAGGSVTLTSTTGAIIVDGSPLEAAIYVPGGPSPSFSVTSGPGGNGGNLAGSIGGNSGDIGNNGNAGNGGKVTIKTGPGAYFALNGAVSIVALGGGAGIMSASSGNAGFGAAKGGNSGKVGNGGNAGNGGTVTLTSQIGTVLANGSKAISAAGGDQSAFTSKSGSGGEAKLSGAGGNSGNVGNGGNAGNGGKITISSGNANSLFSSVLANGGSTQMGFNFTAQSGNGGDGKTAGGKAGSVGNQGNAGKGGTISITGTGNQTFTNIDTSGGATPGLFNAIGGNGGGNAATGGAGGSVGKSSAGGSAGNLTVKITGGQLNLDTALANGQAGAANNGTGGNGGATSTKGGAAGSVGLAGNGGNGGVITLSASNVNITTPGSLSVSSKGGNGGDQTGDGGVGTNGGKGGSVANAGNGGSGNNITISVPNNAVAATSSASKGTGGIYSGIVGGGTPPGTPGTNGKDGAKDGVIKTTYLDDDSQSEIDDYKKKVKQWKRQIAKDSTTRLHIANADTQSVHYWLNDSTTDGSFAKVEVSDSYDDSANSTDANEFGPVAFVQSVPVLEKPDLSSKSNSVPLVKASALSKDLLNELSGWATFEAVSGSKYKMLSGTLLLAPQNSTLELTTPAGVVAIQPGAKAIVHIKEAYLALLNLHDQHAGQVVVRSHGSEISATMGQEIIIGPDNGSDLTAINPCPEVSVRDVKSHAIKGGQRVFSADFSLMSALMNHSTLKSLQLSQSADHKKHLEQLLKNAIVINYVTAKHGVYKGRF